MFGLIWLRGKSVVAEETSALDNLKKLLATIPQKAVAMRQSHPGNEPDGIQIKSASGRDVKYVSLHGIS